MSAANSSVPIVTIDGPSSSGKGTISRIVASRVGWNLLDSGALYRLVALGGILKDLDPDDVEEVEALTSDHRPEDLNGWLSRQRQREAIALVGHEPHLGLLVGYLLGGKSASFVDLKKGGACLIDMDDPSKPGSGCLEWLLGDRELRRLGE